MASSLTSKETSIENCLDAKTLDLSVLKEIAWIGIPKKYRAQTWKLLIGYLPASKGRREQCLARKRKEYENALEHQIYKNLKKNYFTSQTNVHCDDSSNSISEPPSENSPRSSISHGADDKHYYKVLHQIINDVPRTAPSLGLFSKDQRVLDCMERILFLWAVRHPASSYVQGINELITPLFSCFLSDYFGNMCMLSGDSLHSVSDKILLEVEADSYWCFCCILDGIQDFYTHTQPGVNEAISSLEQLTQRINPDLSKHLSKFGLKFTWFAFRWINCFLMREFNLTMLTRMWDCYLSEEYLGFRVFHVYVCAALLQQFSHELLQICDFEGLFYKIQNLPTKNWNEKEIEMLLSQAHILRTLYSESSAHLSSTNNLCAPSVITSEKPSSLLVTPVDKRRKLFRVRRIIKRLGRKNNNVPGTDKHNNEMHEAHAR